MERGSPVPHDVLAELLTQVTVVGEQLQRGAKKRPRVGVRDRVDGLACEGLYYGS
jgi:hypothetical protein